MKEMVEKDKFDEQDELYENNTSSQYEREDSISTAAPRDVTEMPFKLWLVDNFNYFDEHYTLTTLIKFFFGFIILVVPLICMIIFTLIDFEEKKKYFLFPYFITVCFVLGFLIILFIIKLCESCQTHGITIFTWERKNLFNILNAIFLFICVLWLLFFNETFLTNFEVLKERVSQVSDNSNVEVITGSYTLRILFILFFWDSREHDYLETFEFEETTFFKQLHSLFDRLLIPVIFYCCIILIKNIIFNNDKYYLYIVLRVLVLFQSIFFMLYFNSGAETEKDESKKSFSFGNTGCKYFELIIYILMIIVLVILSFKQYVINLLHKKYYPSLTKEKNNITIVLCLTSFTFCLLGYSLLTYLIFSLTFTEIKSELYMDYYIRNWVIIYLILFLLANGYSFIFGNYIYNLIFYPVSYEKSPHIIKNEFYVKCVKIHDFDYEMKNELQGNSFELNDIIPSSNNE